MNKIVAAVALVVFLALAGMVVWQSAGAGDPAPVRPGTHDYYATQNARKSTEAAIRKPLLDARNCLAEGRPADCRD